MKYFIYCRSIFIIKIIKTAKTGWNIAAMVFAWNASWSASWLELLWLGSDYRRILFRYAGQVVKRSSRKPQQEGPWRCLKATSSSTGITSVPSTIIRLVGHVVNFVHVYLAGMHYFVHCSHYVLLEPGQTIPQSSDTTNCVGNTVAYSWCAMMVPFSSVAAKFSQRSYYLKFTTEL